MKDETGKRYRETSTGSTRPSSNRQTDVEHDVAHIHESRRALVYQPQSRQQSTEDGRKIDHRRQGRDSFPPPKRLRIQKEKGDIERGRANDHGKGHHQMDNRDKRRRPDRSARFVSPEEPQHNYGKRTRSPELLSMARHDNETTGRLSYCNDVFGSSGIRKRSSDVDERQADLQRDNNIERNFPYCDPVWRHEMATFNVDGFLDSMSEYLAAHEQGWSRTVKAPTNLGDDLNEDT